MGTLLIITSLKESPSCGHSPPMIYLHGRAKYYLIGWGWGAGGGGGYFFPLCTLGIHQKGMGVLTSSDPLNWNHPCLSKSGICRNILNWDVTGDSYTTRRGDFFHAHSVPNIELL